MNCPICNKELKEKGDNEENQTWCVNRCYYEEFSYGAYRTTIFEAATFYASYNFDKNQWKEYENDIQEKIDYWKENDRYLMQILAMEQFEGGIKREASPFKVCRRYQRSIVFNKNKTKSKETLF